MRGRLPWYCSWLPDRDKQNSDTCTHYIQYKYPVNRQWPKPIKIYSNYNTDVASNESYADALKGGNQPRHIWSIWLLLKGRFKVMNYWLANALNKLKNTPHFFPSCKNERKEPWRYQIIHEYTMYRYIYKLWVSGYACICWSFKFTISGLSPYVYKYLSSMQNLSPKSLQSFSRVICCTVLTYGNLVVSILIWKKNY